MKNGSSILSIVLILWCACGLLEPGIAHAGEETGQQEEGELADWWPAVSLPESRVVLSSELDEDVAQVVVEEGDVVEKGDPLVKFDARKIKARIAVAKVETDFEDRIKQTRQRMEFLQREYERSRKLAEGEPMISESDLDTDRTKMELARHELAELERKALLAQQQLKLQEVRAEDFVLRSPLRGVVSHLWVETGEFAEAGQKLVEIVDPNRIEVCVHLPERHAMAVKPGQKVVVRVPCARINGLEGRVCFVSPYVDSSSGTFLVKASASARGECFKPGMGCFMRFKPRVPKEKTAQSSR